MNRIALSLLITFSWLQLSSQEITIGSKCGLDDSKSYIEGYNNFKHSYGTYFGVTGDIIFSNNFSISSGLIKENKSLQTAAFSSQIKMKYLTIPLIINISIGNKIKLNGNLGIYNSYLYKATLIESFFWNSDTNAKDEIGKFDFGYVYGVSIDLNILPKMILGFEYRIQPGSTQQNYQGELFKNRYKTYGISLRYILKNNDDDLKNQESFSPEKHSLYISYTPFPYLIYGISYFRNYKINDNLSWGPSFGLANSEKDDYWPIGFHIPFSANLIWGNNKNYLESGLGITLNIDKFSVNIENEDDYGFASSLYPSAKIGYLFQPKSKGLSFRIYLTAYYSINNSFNNNYDRHCFVPKIGIGYS
jgi:hypothetical protein